jgi:hypothetical protein
MSPEASCRRKTARQTSVLAWKWGLWQGSAADALARFAVPKRLLP